MINIVELYFYLVLRFDVKKTFSLFHSYAFQFRRNFLEEKKFVKEFKRFHNRATFQKKERKLFLELSSCLHWLCCCFQTQNFFFVLKKKKNNFLKSFLKIKVSTFEMLFNSFRIFVQAKFLICLMCSESELRFFLFLYF